MQRLSWENYALELAKTASLRSEDPFKKVGACALSKDNRVLGVSYNGLKSKFDVDCGFWKDRNARRPYMIHAETNLFSLFGKDECGLIAVTLLPCAACAKLIVAWDVPKVVYGEEYDHDDALHTKEIFDFYKVNYIKL
jgi:dCMP deaminase